MIAAAAALTAVAGPLAKSGEAVKSGPIGLAVILLLCVACYFLFKSMSKHLRTVREDFPPDTPAPTSRPNVGEPGQQVESVDLRKAPGTIRPSRPGPPPPPVHP